MDEKTIALAVTAFLAVFTAWGLILGLIRGLWRTLARDAWLAAIALFLALSSSAIVLSACGEDVSQYNYTINGQRLVSVNALLEQYVVSATGADAQSAQAIAGVAAALFSAAAGGVLFLVFFIALKIITLPLYYILNILIFAPDRNKKRRATEYKKQSKIAEKYPADGDKKPEAVKYSKHRLLGGLCGALSGFAVAAVLLAPISGYINLAAQIDEVTAPSENQSGVITANAGDVYVAVSSGYKQSTAAKIFAMLGVDKMQSAIFDSTASAKINGNKIILSNEASVLSQAYLKLSDAYAKISPYLKNKAESADDAVITVAVNEFSEAIDVVFKSAVIKSALPAAASLAAAYIEKSFVSADSPEYMRNFVAACASALKKSDAASAENDVKSVVGVFKTLAEAKMLLPIFRNEINATLLKTTLTKEVCSDICSQVFSLSVVKEVAPSLGNFLLGYVGSVSDAELTDQDFAEEQIQKSATDILISVVDLLPIVNDANKFNPDGLTVNVATAAGKIFDSVKGLLSETNYVSVMNYAEKNIKDGLASVKESLPAFISQGLDGVVDNLSEADKFEDEFGYFYSAYSKIKTAYDGAVEEDKFKPELLDLAAVGEGMDILSDSVLVSGGVFSGIAGGGADYLGEQLKTIFGGDFTVTFTDKLKSNISAAIDADSVVWKDELPLFSDAISELSKLFSADDAFAELKKPENEALKNIGAGLDKMKTGVLFGGGADNLFVKDLLNIAKQNIAEDELGGALKTATDEISDNISGNAIVWKNELENVHTLISFDFGVYSDDNVISLGDKLDAVVFGADDKAASLIITRSVADKLIVSFSDSIFEGVTSENDFYDALQSVKAGFDGETVLSYAAELGAAIKLKAVKDVVSGEGFSFNTGARTVGGYIDDALAKNGKIINKTLINSYIEKSVDKYVNVAADGQFADIIDNIKDRLALEFSYKTEFGYVQDVLYVSDNCGDVTLANVGNKTAYPGEQPSEAKNLGERLDAVAPSLLAGDCGLSALSAAMKTYSDENVGFSSVNTVIVSNFNGIKPDVKCAANYDDAHTVKYVDLMNAFTDIYSAMTEESSKITGNTDFDAVLAASYEKTLNDLQDNIVVQKNGARAMAAYVAGEVKNVILGKKPDGANPVVSAAFDSVAAYVDDYIAYLGTTADVTDNEPYADATTRFAYSADGYATVDYGTDETKEGYKSVRVNRPFGYVYDKLSVLLA